MDTSYRELKCKDVVNVTDGRNLGRTCDIVFSFPEGKVYGIVVPGKRGFRFFKNNDLFIALKNVVKIGADVGKRPGGFCPPQGEERRDFGEYE